MNLQKLIFLQYSASSVNHTKEINAHLQLTGTHLELTESNLSPNKQKRQMYKNFMNSTIGKFSQRPAYTTTTFVSTAEEIDNVLEEHAINDFTVLGDDICELQTSTSTRATPCRKTNPVISSFVTALSRIDMHKYIIHLAKHKYVPAYTDTDSLIFFGGPEKKDKTVPLPISPKFGDFREEYSSHTLSGFCCIGKKNYAVSLNKKEADNHGTLLKVRGLSLKAKNAQASVNFQTFKNFLTNNSRPPPSIPQQRLITKSKSFEISRKVTNIKLATDLNFNRILTNSAHYTTLPYGYVNKGDE